MPFLGRALILLGFFVSASVWSATNPSTPEYQLKAVFLFNFTQFVEWPPAAFGDAQSPMSICVLGTDPFGPYLDEVIQGEKINGRTLLVEHIKQNDDIGRCHILYVSRSEEPRIEQILKQLDDHSVLTVSDIEGFAEKGGVIGFFTAGSKIRFRINVASAKRADLTISSKLLRPAEIVAAE